MKLVQSILLSIALLLPMCVADTYSNCRFMSDCPNEGLQWKKLPSSTDGVGLPGERGPPGPKGDPGLGVNITEFQKEWNELEREKEPDGPQLFFYTQSITYNSGKGFCRGLGKRICRSSELCIRNEEGGRELIPDVIPGDNWVPVLDGPNEWLQSGHSYGRTCMLHSENLGMPSWGTSATAAVHKGYVYCCKEDAEASLEEMRYQYIGKTANYIKSEQHCENQGLRLCYASEVCSNNVPYYGAVEGDQWVAVKDRENEWVEIGNDRGRTCWVHGVTYTAPPWGIRTEGEVPYVGFVLCCAQ